jgi:two-component system cell cycle sensor histidine kinase/response regulator CckA
VVPRSVRVQHDAGAAQVAVTADPTQLRQVVMNLLLNGADAIVAANREGTVHLRTGTVTLGEVAAGDLYFPHDPPPGAYVLLHVRDTGCGISADALPRVFEPFFTTKVTGRGVGLASTLGILRAHNGFVRVETVVGVGTTFEVLLPA